MVDQTINKNFSLTRGERVPQKSHKSKTYVPPVDAFVKEWSGPMGRLVAEKGKWKMIEVGGGSSYLDNSQTSKKYLYVSKNYMGKNPMTCTQWRRHQRNKKDASEASSMSKNNNVKALADEQKAKKHVK